MVQSHFCGLPDWLYIPSIFGRPVNMLQNNELKELVSLWQLSPFWDPWSTVIRVDFYHPHSNGLSRWDKGVRLKWSRSKFRFWLNPQYHWASKAGAFFPCCWVSDCLTLPSCLCLQFPLHFNNGLIELTSTISSAAFL